MSDGMGKMTRSTSPRRVRDPAVRCGSPRHPAEDGPDPWERQPGETARAFHAFTLYRDMRPHDRSLRLLGEREDTADPRQIQRWSSDHQWVGRCTAWDDELDRIKRAATQDEVEAMTKRHIRIALDMQDRLAARLEELDASELTPGHLARWVEVAIRLEREARGLAGSKVAVEHQGDVNMNSGTALARAILADDEATDHALAALSRVARTTRQRDNESSPPGGNHAHDSKA